MTKWEQTSIPLEQQRAARQLPRLTSSTVKCCAVLNHDQRTPKSFLSHFLFLLRLASIDRIFILLHKRPEMVASLPDIELQDVIRCFLCTASGGTVKKLHLHEL